ncbi:MAG: hypothetical protein COB67_12130, partial [SAR324 cluster bacterium]
KQLESGEALSNPKEQVLAQVLHHAAHSLLVTRGIESNSPAKTYEMFQQHFIRAGLIPKSFQALISLAQAEDDQALLSQEALIYELADQMKELYDGMDDTLQFKVSASQSATAQVEAKAPVAESKAAPLETIEQAAETDVFKDFKGVSCPMNFVKTKLALAPMVAGQTLAILLDDGAPIENVPNSVKLEGHTILEQKQLTDGSWSVVIQKS